MASNYVTVRILLHGLLLFVPQSFENPGNAHVIFVDAYDPPVATDGCPIHRHRPWVMFEAGAECQPEHCERAYGLCRCELEKATLSFVGEFSRQTPFVPDEASSADDLDRHLVCRRQGTREICRVQMPGQLRALEVERQHADLIRYVPPVLGRPAMSGNQVTPSCLGVPAGKPIPRPAPDAPYCAEFKDRNFGHMVAAATCLENVSSWRACTLFSGRAEVPLRALVNAELGPVKRTMASLFEAKFVLKVADRLAPLELDLRAFDGTRPYKLSVPTFWCDEKKERRCADLVLTNLMEGEDHSHGGRCRSDQINRDFELFHDLLDNPDNFDGRKVPYFQAKPDEEYFSNRCESRLVDKLRSFLRRVHTTEICSPGSSSAPGG